MSQIDFDLEMRDRATYRRKLELHKEWNDKVYGTVQAQIDQQLARMRTEDISTRRRQLMDEYIKVSNQKPYGLYRDIIIESEYDPLIAHRDMLKYKVSDKNDPLKLELNASMEGKPKVPLGRATLPPTMWDNLHSTPYGRFDRIIPMNIEPGVYASRVNFEHYKIARDPEALNREFPRGKRVQCDGQQRDQHKSTIFEGFHE